MMQNYLQKAQEKEQELAGLLFQKEEECKQLRLELEEIKSREEHATSFAAEARDDLTRAMEESAYLIAQYETLQKEMKELIALNEKQKVEMVTIRFQLELLEHSAPFISSEPAPMGRVCTCLYLMACIL